MTYARRTDTTQQPVDRGVAINQRSLAKLNRPRKYRNVPTIVDGIKCASKLEAKRWGELKLLEKAGEITGLKRQHPIYLMCGAKPILMKSDRYPRGRHAKYMADFHYLDLKKDRWIVEETKGFETRLYLLKRALMQAMGYEIQEIRK